MAESDSARSESARSESAPSDGDRGESRGRSRSLGRAIATALVVALLAYLIGVGFYSVVPAIFWPDVEAPHEGVTCAEGLRDLRSELLARAGERVASGGGERAALRGWLDEWDRRHLALEARCADQPEAWELVGRLRQRVQGTLERFDAHERELTRDLDRTLARANGG